MNSFNQILLDTIKESTVATAAGFSQSDWAYRVFNRRGQTEFTREINIGRLPCVEIYDTNSSSDLSSLSNTNYLQGGSFTIRIINKAFGNSIDSSIQKLHEIKQAILQAIPNSFGMIGFTHSNVVISPICCYIDLVLTNESNQTNQYED